MNDSNFFSYPVMDANLEGDTILLELERSLARICLWIVEEAVKVATVRGKGLKWAGNYDGLSIILQTLGGDIVCEMK